MLIVNSEEYGEHNNNLYCLLDNLTRGGRLYEIEYFRRKIKNKFFNELTFLVGEYCKTSNEL